MFLEYFISLKRCARNRLKLIRTSNFDKKAVKRLKTRFFLMFATFSTLLDPWWSQFLHLIPGNFGIFQSPFFNVSRSIYTYVFNFCNRNHFINCQNLTLSAKNLSLFILQNKVSSSCHGPVLWVCQHLHQHLGWHQGDTPCAYYCNYAVFLRPRPSITCSPCL